MMGYTKELKQTIAMIFLVLIAGCDSGRYQFTEARNGNILGYMTDTVTGDLSYCFVTYNSSGDIVCHPLPSQK